MRNKSIFPDDYYLGGRCHLFAYVMAEILNLPVTVWWDDEALDEDFDIIPEPCLVHAVVTIGKDIDADITGCDARIENFECNSLRIEIIERHEFAKVIKDKGWLPFHGDSEYQGLIARAMQVIDSNPDEFASFFIERKNVDLKIEAKSI